ncbi:hypothetical protein ATANTOWER_031075 [Ataeniobius toweri]|uniref:CDCP1 third and sixth CUB domain-containing protein n=1 Tax=Ataeniobius toweri TaxID=208326 RepID=A0ABU7BP39_9TELE|nr:hypothetical protein [Ataeniobius toweri]
MYPPLMKLADEQQASAIDLWVQQQMVEALRNLSNVLKVLPSPLLLEEEMEQEAAQHQGHQGGCLFLVPQLQLSLLPVLVSPAAPLAVHRRNHKAASTLVPWDLPDTSTPFCCLLEVLSPDHSSALHSRDSHARASLFTSPACCSREISDEGVQVDLPLSTSPEPHQGFSRFPRCPPELLRRFWLFIAAVSIVSATTKVSLTFLNESSMTLLSPNYPDSFPNDYVMEWYFQVPNKHKAAIRLLNQTQPTCAKKETGMEYSRGAIKQVVHMGEVQPEQNQGNFSLRLRNCQMDPRHFGSSKLSINFTASTLKTGSPGVKGV